MSKHSSLKLIGSARDRTHNLGSFLKILAFVLVLCLAVCASCALDDHLEAIETNKQAGQRITSYKASIGALLSNKDYTADDLIRDCTGLETAAKIDPAFIDEALDPNDFEYAYCSGSLICFISTDPPSKCAEKCTNLLAEKGWVLLNDQDQNIASFVKAYGTYTWLVVQYLSIDERTTVLINTDSTEQSSG